MYYGVENGIEIEYSVKGFYLWRTILIGSFDFRKDSYSTYRIANYNNVIFNKKLKICQYSKTKSY